MIDTDVLVIGSGIAGCTTTIHVNKRGAEVIIINKLLFLQEGGQAG